uniref:Uncharacterized protein n=1 Tax=Timema genevievae TaxID=629358 RepID=A0A7R9K326_TIMGE|nr:unnamed protein product [Timema genevievae]
MELIKILTTSGVSRDPEQVLPKSPELVPFRGRATQGGEPISFTRLPMTKPVDIRFEDLGYTVSLGFRKGRVSACLPLERRAVEWLQGIDS